MRGRGFLGLVLPFFFVDVLSFLADEKKHDVCDAQDASLLYLGNSFGVLFVLQDP